MKPKVDYNSLVILGSWNKAIFNPEWVSKYLLPKEKYKSEFVFDNGVALRYSTENLRIFALENRLIFTILKYDDSVFKEIHELSFKIVDYLPHTPVTAFGVNFIYESEENEFLANILKLNDETDYSKYDLKIFDTQIKRTFKKENFDLNLLVSKNNDVYKIDFNFHFNIKSLVEYKSIFDLDKYLSFKKFTLDLLSESYKITLSI